MCMHTAQQDWYDAISTDSGLEIPSPRLSRESMTITLPGGTEPLPIDSLLTSREPRTPNRNTSVSQQGLFEGSFEQRRKFGVKDIFDTLGFASKVSEKCNPLEF